MAEFPKIATIALLIKLSQIGLFPSYGSSVLHIRCDAHLCPKSCDRACNLRIWLGFVGTIAELSDLLRVGSLTTAKRIFSLNGQTTVEALVEASDEQECGDSFPLLSHDWDWDKVLMNLHDSCSIVLIRQKLICTVSHAETKLGFCGSLTNFRGRSQLKKPPGRQYPVEMA